MAGDEGGEGRRTRRRRLDRGAPGTLAMLIPGAMTVALAFRSGGYFPGAAGLAAAELAVLTAVRFVLARKPLVGFNRWLVTAIVAIGVLTGWTLLSARWSGSFARALPAYSDAVLYGLALVCFGSFPFNPRRTRTMAWGIGGAIVCICLAALTARLLPHVIFDPSLVKETRLAYPLTYWNALGILACVGLVLCFHFAADARGPALARVLGAAALPILALTLLYTLSRGAIWAAAAALLVYLVLGRPRGVAGALLAAGPPTVVAVLVATPTAAVTTGYPDLTVGPGRHVAIVLGLCVVGAFVLRAAALPLDRAALRLRFPAPRRDLLLGGLGAVALILVVAGVAAGAPGVVHDKYDEFTDRADTGPAAGESRLTSVRPEARLALWDAAIDAYHRDELRGTGAGTYPLAWELHHEGEGHILDAHSLYLETLGDLGLVGFLALLVALAGILGAFAFRAIRGPDRTLFAALFAAGLAWAVHAGVDWDWQMPAVTLWLFALGGATLSRPLQRRRRRLRRGGRGPAVRVAGVTACLALAILPARLAISQAHLESALAAMQGGDCAGARGDARAALAAVGQRPTPYQVIGYCDLEQGRYRAAARAMAAAWQRDPKSHLAAYDLAVARAAAGLDPRAAILAARRLNPTEARTAEAVAALTTGGPADWRAAGRRAALVPPLVEGP